MGVRGGAEAVAHAARRYLAEMGPDQVLVKLDFINAFNSVRRDAVLEAVALHVPELLAFTKSAYGAPSILQFGDEQVLSEEGVQQGDPLGPLFFSWPSMVPCRIGWASSSQATWMTSASGVGLKRSRRR